MPTPSEQKALAFVAIVILRAGAVRVGRAGGLARPDPSPLEQQGLARQAFAASSASVSQRNAKDAREGASGKKKPRLSLKRRDDVVNVVGGVASVPPVNRLGFPPPGPRVDVDWAARDGLPSGTPERRRSPGSHPGTPIDLDSAPAEEIESLPKVGPALAKRIVANRDSLGPFRSLGGLRRVKGIGPSTAALLAPLVTFSGQTRP
jgi:competence protein ComEA